MQIVSIGDNLHDMPNPFPGKNNETFQNCRLLKFYPMLSVKLNAYSVFKGRQFGGHEVDSLVQLTLVISNNRLSWSENLVPVLTWKSNNRQQNFVEKRRNCTSFPQYFQQSLTPGVKLQTYLIVKCDCSFYFFLSSANRIRRDTDISMYFRESLGLWDNESRLYLKHFKMGTALKGSNNASRRSSWHWVSSTKKGRQHMPCRSYFSWNRIKSLK